MESSCRSCHLSDAGLSHRLSGHPGIPSAAPAKRQDGQLQRFRFLYLQAGNGLQRFACSAVMPQQSFYGTVFNKRPPGMNFNIAGLLPARSLATTSAVNSPGRRINTCLSGCLPERAVPAPATSGVLYARERRLTLRTEAAGFKPKGGRIRLFSLCFMVLDSPVSMPPLCFLHLFFR